MTRIAFPIPCWLTACHRAQPSWRPVHRLYVVGVAWVALLGASWSHAAPTVNGLFYGDGDNSNYVLYNTSVGGSKLWYTVSGNRLYVALVVARTVNDNVFGNRDYTANAGWGPPHPANRLVDSEFAEFTLTVGSTSYTWQQGYGALVGGVWKSDHTTGAGSGTPPPNYVSSSSFAWNINNYLANPSPNWNLYVNGTGINNWKSPFETNAPNTVLGLDGYPASGEIGYSPYYQWEWPMVYEWSVDLSGFGPQPIFVISAKSHHSPAKTGGENDPFPTPPGTGFLTDYGDLPSPYPTLLANNGARHYIVANGAYLGSTVDPEPDGQPHPFALGDDLGGADDEDGIVLLDPLIPGQTARIQVTAGTAGFLSAFIDWDGNGSLDSVTLVSATGPTTLTAGIIGDMELAAGVYELTISVPANAAGIMPARFRFTNASGQGGNSATGLATTGEVEDYIFTVSIGDRVWKDLDKDGIQDAGEPGLVGVAVQLYDSGNTLLASTTTDADGEYRFEGLLPGDYYVKVVPPSGYYFSAKDQGADDALDSDADPSTGQMATTTLHPGENDIFWDAGLYAVGAIGDTIFYDWNGDGGQNAGEAGISNVTVTLTPPAGVDLGNGPGNPVTRITDAHGYYLFDNLPAGSYTVSVPAPGAGGVPTGYTLTSDPDSTLDGQNTVVLATDNIYLDADFGYQPAGVASIGDTVFEDKDGDGVFNHADVGIVGVTVWLYHDVNGDGILDAGDLLIATTATAGGGQYTFAGLDPGLNYLVLADDGVGSEVDDYFVTDHTRTTAANPIAVGPADFTAQSNAVIDADFGYQAPLPASISGHAFEDVDNDGLLDGGDVLLPNVTVTLYVLDASGNRILAGTTETDANGFYEFTDLPAGVYVVVVATGDPDIPSGLITGVPDQIVVLAAGDMIEDVDFPFVPLIVKTVDKANALSGDELTYTITVNPPAAGPVQNLAVVDPLPVGTSFVAAGQNGAFDAAANQVAWDLGSTAPGIQGTLTARPRLFAFRGGDTQTFWKYDVNDGNWTEVDSFGTNVGPGGALISTTPDGGVETGDVFGLRGNGSQDFRRYNIWTPTADEWVDRASVGSAGDVGDGGALGTFGGFVYALVGNGSSEFRRYDPATDTWTAMAPTPQPVGRGSALFSDRQTGLYALRGNNSPTLWRYVVATDSWEVKAPAPANIGVALGGAAMASWAGNLYVLRGEGTTTFWRYNMAADLWSTTAADGTPLPPAPAPIVDGAGMAFRSIRLFVLAGGGRGFYRFNIAENNWTTLANAPADVLPGSSITSSGGVAARETQIFATPYVVRDGSLVTVQVNLSACQNCPNETDVAPPANLTVTATGGASATQLSGPEPALQDLPSGSTRFYYYTFEVAAASNTAPQSLTFSVPTFDSGNLPSSFPPASSQSVIVVPELTLTVKLDLPFPTSQADNTAQIFGEVQTGLGVCYLLAKSSDCGDGIARLLRVDAGGVADLGPTGTALAGALAWGPDASRLYTADGNRFGYFDINTGAFIAIGNIVAGSGTAADTAMQGAAGDVVAADLEVVGLAFAPDGTLYAVQRQSGSPDRLFQIDPLTGRHVENAFGSGRDYRVIAATSGRQDIEALAFDADGTLYAVAANTGTPAAGDLLVTLADPAAASDTLQPVGVANSLSPAGLLWVDADLNSTYQAGEELFDVKGLSITANGRVEIVTGADGPANYANGVFIVNPATALSYWVGEPAGGCDYQAIACSDQRPFSDTDAAQTSVTTVPLAAAIDFRALATAGGVAVEFRTIEEAGYNDIVLYVWLGGAWVEVGRATAHGEGDHLYQFTIAGLDSTQLHDFKIEDDEGYTHYVTNLAADPFAATMVRMERDGIGYTFDSIPDRTYDIYRAASPVGPWGDPVKTVTADDYLTDVVLPKAPGAASAFFKTVLRGK